jgi:hypothetical protein
LVGTKKAKPASKWHIKNIANNLPRNQAIALAELEVFSQEYRRLLCPTHLFNGKNIYTKYRLAYDEKNTDNIYVASKSLNLMGSSGNFSFDTQGVITFDSDSTTGVNLKDIPGFACSCFFAKFLGEADFKIKNAVIINDGLKPDGTPQLYFSQIDSEWCFAGTANKKFSSLHLNSGLLTAKEVINNPFTTSNCT